MAVVMVTKLVAPNIWGWIADHSGHRIAVIRLASLLSLLVFASILEAESFWTIALVMAVYSFFWNASLPQFEVVTLNWLGRDTHRYSLVRLWGSIGFIAAVGLLGLLLDHYPVTIVPGAMLLSLGGILLASLLIGEGPRDAQHDEAHPPLSRVLRQPAVAAFLVACFLMQAGHGVYYSFFSIWMTDAGYDKGETGAFWAIGVLAEVGLFLVMHRLMRRYPARLLVLASLVIAALRWLMIGLFPGLAWLILIAQLLHAVTFGVFHAAAIQLVHDFFPGRLQGRGQALYSSLSFGAGGALGSLAGGWLWDAWSPVLAFVAASGVSLLAALVTWRWMRGAGREPA
jgi:PPP family 3-phenylpropionic acid transporter